MFMVYNKLMITLGAPKSYVASVSVLAVLTSIATISGFVLSSSFSHAETSSVLASVTVPDVCTIAADNSSTAHTDTVGVGEYKANIGETVFNITCNDNNGYSIYAVGYSNNTEGNTNLIGTTNSSNTIPTGTSTATGSNAVSNWAMKLTAVSGTFPATILEDSNGLYSNYHVVPSIATKVATRTSSIDLSADSKIKTTYAVSISPAQTADSYVGKVKYTVVHPNYSNADGTISRYDIPVNFAGTGVSSVTFTATGQSSQTVSVSGNSVNLIKGVEYTMTATFTSGYELANWALNNANYGTLGSTSTNPTTFTPNANSASASLTITGQEKPKVYIQDLTPTACQVNVGTNGNAANVGDEITVYDKRDGSDYTVRYINGECWMTQNLRYLGDTGSAAGTMTIGNSNSNVANKSITLYSLDSSNAGSFGAYSSHCDSTNGYNNACVYDSGSTSTGVWYNYYAATAGTVSTNFYTNPASQNICPKNWHLPSGPTTTSTTDFNKLVGTTGSGWQNATDGFTAFGAVAGGYYDNGSLGSTGYGRWWSRAASDTTGRYCLGYNSSNGQFSGISSNSRYYGRFVRCVRPS